MLYPLSAKLLLRPGDFLLCVIYRPPTSCNLEGNFHFFLEFWMREVSLSSLSLKKKGIRECEGLHGGKGKEGRGGSHKTWNAQEGSHRSEAILTHRLPSLPSSFVSCSFSSLIKGKKGTMEQEISKSSWTCKQVHAFWGGLSVSASPVLSLVTPLTPQEALDVSLAS